MTEYLIIKREPCTNCENGWIQNPIWAAFFEQFPSWPEIEGERAYWAERGYRKGPPNEEEPCYECGGVGVIGTEIGLIEALTELNVDLKFISPAGDGRRGTQQ